MKRFVYLNKSCLKIVPRTKQSLSRNLYRPKSPLVHHHNPSRRVQRKNINNSGWAVSSTVAAFCMDKSVNSSNFEYQMTILRKNWRAIPTQIRSTIIQKWLTSIFQEAELVTTSATSTTPNSKAKSALKTTYSNTTLAMSSIKTTTNRTFSNHLSQAVIRRICAKISWNQYLKRRKNHLQSVIGENSQKLY